MKIDWHDYIVTDKDIIDGKPIFNGTRLSVEFITGLFASGWSKKEILKNYPKLKEKNLQAMNIFIYECMKDSLMFKLPK
ncbi:MAG: DUF433 domain-containing protein [Bacteroidota bacterium]|nr:DUF433 domain-containing protein [Bacteroidota bacterium]